VDPSQTPLGPGQGLPDSLTYYYPGSCLVTARDIITLWVARMQLAGLYNLGDVPFTDCFIHANIQDGKGERMSKSKGNGIDPVDIIDRYGTDALRYVLCDMQSGTQDIRLPVQAESPFTGHLIDLAAAQHGRSIFTYICPESGKEFDVLGTIPELPKATLVSDRFEVGRAFCTKLWNAARFAFLSLGQHTYAPLSGSDLKEEDRWILSRLSKTIETVTAHLQAYNPSAAITTARDFFWSEVCDWYIEMIKPRFKTEEETRVARSVLSVVLDQIFRLFHPFVPFITEVLWEHLNEQAPVRGLSEPLPGSELLLHAQWPVRVQGWEDEGIEKDFELLQDVVREIRNVRAKYNLPPKNELTAVIKASGGSMEALNRLSSHIRSQAYVVSLEISETPRPVKHAATGVVGDVEIYLEGVLDPDKERTRLEKQKADILKEIEMREKKLSNESFVSRAKPEVVQMEKDRLADAKAQLESLDKAVKGFE
jgi:valyl-tRNA synthetase